MSKLKDFYWVRSIWGLLRYLFRRSPDRSILRHEIQRIDASSVRASVERGEPFALRLGEVQRNITVAAAPVAEAAAGVVVDGAETDVEDTIPAVVFAGSVEGDSESDVRLTITDDLVMGYVRTGDDWFWIDPLRRFRSDAATTEHVIYRSADTAFRLPFGTDDPVGQTAEPEQGNKDHRVNPHVGIAMWGDVSFRDQAQLIGLSWPAAQATLVNLVNGIYQRELGIQFVVRVFVLHVGSSLSSNKAQDLLRQFGTRVQVVNGDIRRLDVRQRTNIEVAHLLTGRNLDGRTIGIAWRPGVWGLSEHHHFPVNLPWLRHLEANLVYKNMMVAAHELGHNFSGRHDLADKECVTHFIWCWDHERTIMWDTFYSDNRDEFSAANSNQIGDNANNGRNVNYTHT